MSTVQQQSIGKAQPLVSGIEVEDFRGLRRASLSNFAGINVLVGKNGSGKSSILEALYIGLTLGDGLDNVVDRRGWFGLASVEALFHYKAREAKIRLSLRDGTHEDVIMKIAIPDAEDLKALETRDLNISNIAMLDLSAKGKIVRSVKFYIDVNGKKLDIVSSESGVKIVRDVVFADWGSVYSYETPEKALYAMVKEGGVEAKNAVVKALRVEYGELRNLEVLPAHDKWVLHLTFKDKAIPYYVEGDGIRYALMYLMRLLTSKKVVLLLEEPELHTHPSLMRIVVRAIVDSYIERENQLFISTHSLEFIRMLLEESRESGLKDQDLKVYRLRLVNGKLDSEEYVLNEAWEVLDKLEWDLRR